MKKERLKIMFDIAKKAKEKGLLMFDTMSLVMDLKKADEFFGLRLDDLIETDDSNFAHDIVGIQNHIDRKGKVFINGFVPRFSGDRKWKILKNFIINT